MYKWHGLSVSLCRLLFRDSKKSNWHSKTFFTSALIRAGLSIFERGYMGFPLCTSKLNYSVHGYLNKLFHNLFHILHGLVFSLFFHKKNSTVTCFLSFTASSSVVCIYQLSDRHGGKTRMSEPSLFYSLTVSGMRQVENRTGCVPQLWSALKDWQSDCWGHVCSLANSSPCRERTGGTEGERKVEI